MHKSCSPVAGAISPEQCNTGGNSLACTVSNRNSVNSSETGFTSAPFSLANASIDAAKKDLGQPICTGIPSSSRQPWLPHISACSSAGTIGTGFGVSETTAAGGHGVVSGVSETTAAGGHGVVSGHSNAVESSYSKNLSVMCGTTDSSTKHVITNSSCRTDATNQGIHSFSESNTSELKRVKESSSSKSKEQLPQSGCNQETEKQQSSSGVENCGRDSSAMHTVTSRQQADMQVNSHFALSGHGWHGESGRTDILGQSVGLPGWSAFLHKQTEPQSEPSGNSLVALNIGNDNKKTEASLHVASMDATRKPSEIARDSGASERTISNQKHNTVNLSNTSPSKGYKTGKKARKSPVRSNSKTASSEVQCLTITGQSTEDCNCIDTSGSNRTGSENPGINGDMMQDSMTVIRTPVKRYNNNPKSSSSDQLVEKGHKPRNLEAIANQLRRQSSLEESQLVERLIEVAKKRKDPNSYVTESADHQSEGHSMGGASLQLSNSNASHVNHSMFSVLPNNSKANMSRGPVLENNPKAVLPITEDGANELQVLTVETAKVLCDTSFLTDSSRAAITITKQLNSRSKCIGQSSRSTSGASSPDAFHEAILDASESPAHDGTGKVLPIATKTSEATRAPFPVSFVQSIAGGSLANWMTGFCVKVEKTFNPIFPRGDGNSSQSNPTSVSLSNDPASPTMQHGGVTPSPGVRSEQGFNFGLSNGPHEASLSAGSDPRSSKYPRIQSGPTQSLSVQNARSNYRSGSDSLYSTSVHNSQHLNKNGRRSSVTSPSWKPNTKPTGLFDLVNTERQAGGKHAKSNHSKKSTHGKHVKKSSHDTSHLTKDWPVSDVANYSITTQKYSYASPDSWRQSPSPLTPTSNKPRSQSVSHQRQSTPVPHTPSPLNQHTESPMGIDNCLMMSPRREQQTLMPTAGYVRPKVPFSAAGSLDIHFPSTLRETYRAMHNSSLTNPIRMYDDNMEGGTTSAGMPTLPQWELNSSDSVSQERVSRQPNKAVSIVSPVQTAESGCTAGQSSPRHSNTYSSQSASYKSLSHPSRSLSCSSRSSGVSPNAPNIPSCSVSTPPSNPSRLHWSSFWNQPSNTRPSSMPHNTSTYVATDSSPDPRMAEQEIIYLRNQYRHNLNRTNDPSHNLARRNQSLTRDTVMPDIAKNGGDPVFLQENTDDVFGPPGGNEAWHSRHQLPGNQEHGLDNYRPTSHSRGRDLPMSRARNGGEAAYGNGHLPHFRRSHSCHGTSVSSEDYCRGESPDSGHVTPEGQRQLSFNDHHRPSCFTGFAPRSSNKAGGSECKKVVSKPPSRTSMRSPGPLHSSGPNNAATPTTMESPGSHRTQVKSPSHSGAVYSFNSSINSQRSPLMVNSSSAIVRERTQPSSSNSHPPLIFHQFYRSSTSSTTKFTQAHHQQSHEMPPRHRESQEMPMPPRPSSRESCSQFQNSSFEPDWMKMTKSELEQFRFYLREYLKHSNALLRKVEEKLTAMEGGMCPAPLTQQEINKRFIAITMEPDCSFMEQDQSYRQKFGYGSSGEALNDLIIGGTPESPIINPKYDIYGCDIEREIQP